MTLDQHMTQCMDQAGLRLGHTPSGFHALRQALGTDPEMRAAAQAMIETDPGVLQRDHIAQWRSDLLRRALEQPDDSGGH
jgi:hypothetical protein